MKLRLTLVLAMLACLAPVFAVAQPVAESEAVILVATPQLRDLNYLQTVIVAVPIQNDRHVGVIINRPTRRSLASLFPEHGPSKRVAEPVYFGGPMSPSALFAVVRADRSPGDGSLPLVDHLFLALTITTVDRIIEQTPNEARYYVGGVIWRPGELRAEIDRKLWHVLNADPGIVLRKDTTGLWEEMLRMARAVTADAPDRWVALAH